MDNETFNDETTRAVEAIQNRTRQPHASLPPYHGFTSVCHCGGVAHVDRRAALVCEVCFSTIKTYD